MNPRVVIINCESNDFSFDLGRSYLNDDLDNDEMYFPVHKEESVEDDFLSQLENSKINRSLDK